MKTTCHQRLRRALAITALALTVLARASGAALPDLHPRLEELSHGFTFYSKPVPPRLIEQFNGWLSDGTDPTIITVDLAQAVESNQFDSEPVTHRENGEFSVAGPEEGESFSYEWFGTVRPNVHVLRVSYCGGGTGIFQALLILKAEVRRTTSWDGKPYDQLLLTIVRNYPLGDRDTGKIEVHPGRIVIGRSEYRKKPVTLKVPAL
jgi:hypothetical protein